MHTNTLSLLYVCVVYKSTQGTLPVPRIQVAGARAQTPQETSNDIAILNFALTLEHLESNFYNTFVPYFSSEWSQCGCSETEYLPYLTLIQEHENAHVQLLTAAITSLGGNPVPACTYDFSSITGPAAFLQTAALLENTGK